MRVFIITIAALTVLLKSTSGYKEGNAVPPLKPEPEEDMDVAEIIAYNNYPAEKHYVTTDDGYIIEIQRIPYGRDTRKIDGCTKKRPAVFFMHGLFSSAFQYVINLPSQSAAFIFADAGFDVWLGNVRGTRYGRNHTTLKVHEAAFWNFSIYEYSHFDLRQQVEYILNVTGHESLFYIGHSQGTTVMFERLAEADEAWQKKIRHYYALAPSGGFNHVFFPLSLLANHQIQDIAQVLLSEKHIANIPISLPNFLTSLVARICQQKVINHVCFMLVAPFLGAEDFGQLNETRIPIIVRHFPSVTSTLSLLNWVQIVKYHELRRLDFGNATNLKLYGQPEAPAFRYSGITTPTYLYLSKEDRIADSSDVLEIIVKTYGPGLKGVYNVDHFSHVDFTVGLRANDEIYRPIILNIHEEIKTNGC